MPRVCQFTGARTGRGNRVRHRGRPKYLGGIGTKITSCTRRTIKPNIQKVTALIDGRPVRVKASARAIRQGLVVKPLKRKYAYARDLAREAALKRAGGSVDPAAADGQGPPEGQALER